MNKDWSEQNKEMQSLIGKAASFKEGIKCLLELRSSVFEQITSIVNGYPLEAFWKMPFKGADGYHSKTLAYSIWHIFRIEDIVAHSLIKGDDQILFSKNFLKKTGSRIVTTGNELEGDGIIEFSKTLNVKELYEYAKAVKLSTEEILQNLSFEDLKRTFTEDDKKRLFDSGCVSHEESAVWLIDYWCGKNVAGLIKMPFSRHWIMHVEAMQRIKNRLCKEARKGFYADGNDGANAAKAQALFVSKYGKKAFLKVHDKLHEKYDFAKTQEILGQDLHKGLEILEEVNK